MSEVCGEAERTRTPELEPSKTLRKTLDDYVTKSWNALQFETLPSEEEKRKEDSPTCGAGTTMPS
jgi:hypothetical protein